MKKSKLKSLVKAARKTAEKDIHQTLLASLQEIAGNYGEGNKKLNKDIEKGARRLAKKLATDIKIDKSVFIEVKEETNIAEIATIEAPILVKKEAKVKAVKAPAIETETK
ncbi:MAG: hypothetical protein MUP99_03045 [Pedobacter sp.]|nr:hypothetical protein [Pedobacter sp.]